ncbi:glycine betaine ABC transporter substrate-binding protein [Derxia gummosa]|uniref:Glycine betaine ABC transporter substrate-binding protein n=1 Tax=Derxia gummosa DSM 723 TaxID=1121388 RepID=A0A8B6X382_9BURK|nr:glycine betaine ABC transporter substrate-binding protein [Derxia gummosa]
MKTLSRFKRRAICAALLAVPAFIGNSAHAETKSIKIGWTAWSDAEAITNIAKLVLEQKLGYKVELVMTDVALQYQGVAKGQLDAMLMAWLPNTHKSYMDKFGPDLVDMGALYENAKLGWIVPDYVPAEVKSISDLSKPEYASKFSGKVQGIDQGAGITRLSAQTLKDYGLEGQYKLVTASDAAMVLAIDKATRKGDWIIATAWNPHWLFSKYKMRYLEDPKKSLGGAESIHALARKGLDHDEPKAAAFIRNLKISIPDLETIMLKAKDSSYSAEAQKYIDSHPQLVESWLKDSR